MYSPIIYTVLYLVCPVCSFLDGYSAYIALIRRTVRFGRLEPKAVVSVIFVLDAGRVIRSGKYVYHVFIWSPYVYDKQTNC